MTAEGSSDGVVATSTCVSMGKVTSLTPFLRADGFHMLVLGKARAKRHAGGLAKAVCQLSCGFCWDRTKG